MKNLLKTGPFILLIIAVLYIFFLRECRSPIPCPPDGKMLIAQSTWDSILAIADKPAIVRVDTFWKERPTITPNPQPALPKPEVTTDSDLSSILTDSNEGVFLYRDSLVNKEISVWVDYKIRGELLDRIWRYNPITIEVRRDSIIYIPNIVEIEKPVTRSQNGLYLYGTAGGNANAFLFGGGADFITKKDSQFGYMYQRFGNDNFHSVKFGAKIKFRK